jgi:hypothetical protein
MLQAGYTAADKIAAHELGRNLRTNEWAHMVLPPGLDVVFAELHGNMVDCLPSIEHHNAMIMITTLLEFLLAGIDAGGGRATSASQLDMFVKCSKTIADRVCAVFNQYLIPKMVGYNYKGVLHLPVMKVRKIGDTKAQQQLASGLANLAAQGWITLDDETENWCREQFDMPSFKGTRTPEDRAKKLADTANQNQNGNNPNKGDVSPANQNGGNSGADTQQG